MRLIFTLALLCCVQTCDREPELCLWSGNLSSGLMWLHMFDWAVNISRISQSVYIYIIIKNQSIDPINFCAVQAHLTFWSTLTRMQRCPPAGESRGHTLSPTLRKCGCAPSPQPFTKWTPWWPSRKQTETYWQWPLCAGPWPFAYGSLSAKGANLMCLMLVWWAEYARDAVCTHCFCPFWWTQAELSTVSLGGSCLTLGQVFSSAS